MGRVAETQINIFKGRWKFPELPSWLSEEVWPPLFCHSPSRVPFSSSQNPPFTRLFLGLFIIEIETAVGCVQLVIWQHAVIVDALFSRCSSLLFCTSLAPPCVWLSVYVRAECIDELVFRSMLLLPRADKWRLALLSQLGISFCRWPGSLPCIDVETPRPESQAPFNPTFQFAFGAGRQYWGTADSRSNWIRSNLPKSFEKLWVKTSL